MKAHKIIDWLKENWFGIIMTIILFIGFKVVIKWGLSFDLWVDFNKDHAQGFLEGIIAWFLIDMIIEDFPE